MIKDKPTIKPPEVVVIAGRKYYFCADCRVKVALRDNFCRNCGLRMKQ